MTPEEIRRRMPGAPEEAIEQIIALEEHHRELTVHIKSSKDITGLLDYLEHLFNLIQRWHPTMLEPALKEIVGSFGRIICRAIKLASNNSSKCCAS
jgi:hypothetical protein